MASTISHCRWSVAEHYSTRCRIRRAGRIERARQNLAARSVSLAPLADKTRQERTHLGVSFSLSLAAACHVGVAYAAFSHGSASAAVEAQRVQVKLVEHRVELPPEPAPVIEEKAPEPAPAAEPKKTRPKEAPAPRPEPKAPEPVAIVGLTLESTSGSGSGAAFAVGSTLAGTTGRTAHVPQQLPTAPPEAPKGDVPVSRNRVAQPRAAAGVHVEPAKRMARVEPEYPSLLERQGVEADVTVRVTIAASGSIENVELVRGAADRAFDDAALAAARKERFAPETHDGQPVATSLTYTYRFRIKP
jgi:periplasmic protein TonB